MQKIIAANVRALMDAGRNECRTQERVAEEARKAGFPIDQKSVSRVLKAATAPQADTIEAIARAFDIEPYQLMIPGLDAGNPQVARSGTPGEQKFYDAVAKALREAKAADAKAGTQ